MGGRGASSATATATERSQGQDQRAAFAAIANRAEQAFGSMRAHYTVVTARAAESLYDTDRARQLLEDGNFNRMLREMTRAYGEQGSSTAMGNLEKMLDNNTRNKPMGAGYTNDEWDEAKQRVQGYHYYLERQGFTDYEIAAGLAYTTKLLRRE